MNSSLISRKDLDAHLGKGYILAEDTLNEGVMHHCSNTVLVPSPDKSQCIGYNVINMMTFVILAIIGALTIGVSFYFLLKEDGSEDRYSGFFTALGAILMAPCVLTAIALWLKGQLL